MNKKENREKKTCNGISELIFHNGIKRIGR